MSTPDPKRMEPFLVPEGLKGTLADAQIGRLLQHLRARQLLARTNILVAGDHGEGLGEHGEKTH